MGVGGIEEKGPRAGCSLCGPGMRGMSEEKTSPCRRAPSMEAGIASWRTYLEEDPVGSPSSVSLPSVVFTGGCDFPQLHPPGVCS